ncbi:hypothetical protein [Frigoriglobus tundricola]|uniref:Na(+) H(+) antiporter subunit D n=1 Tax=Frigoriglobus tundricola TaxID=2774151 RepID=A0A6M5YNU1_9BACT|nr:hypothetical protein [Frigoriglobus tundricola]QJW95628.1 Na(+) H(+) antiporter subunit D [Frigoriglobus tundricola]
MARHTRAARLWPPWTAARERFGHRSERTLRAIALGRNNWGVIGSEVGGLTAAVLYSVVGTCGHLVVDPFAYLREALLGLFALGEKPTVEQLLDRLADRWLLNRPQPVREVTAG